MIAQLDDVNRQLNLYVVELNNLLYRSCNLHLPTNQNNELTSYHPVTGHNSLLFFVGFTRDGLFQKLRRRYF